MSKPIGWKPVIIQGKINRVGDTEGSDDSRSVHLCSGEQRAAFELSSSSGSSQLLSVTVHTSIGLSSSAGKDYQPSAVALPTADGMSRDHAPGRFLALPRRSHIPLRSSRHT